MKLRVALAGVVLMAVSVGFAQTPTPTKTPTPTPTMAIVSDEVLMAPDRAPTPTPTPQPTPTPKPKEPTKKPTPTPTVNKKKEEPRIEGTTINRTTGGGFIGFNFVGNNVVLTFYDAKKKKTPVDVTSAVMRWEMKRKTGDDRASFTKGDANTLVSPKAIPPPHNIRFTLMLFKEGSDQAVETYVVTPSG